MKSKASLFLMLVILSASLLIGQGGQQQQPAPLVETTAPNIPGVIAGGTKVMPIKDGFQGTEGPITLPDGSLIFTETNANRITKIDKDNNISTFLENTNGANALGFDAQGRLVAVQTVAGNTKVGVIYPRGSETTFTDNFEGKKFPRPNDMVLTNPEASISRIFRSRLHPLEAIS
jgi:gluconolactonase